MAAAKAAMEALLGQEFVAEKLILLPGAQKDISVLATSASVLSCGNGAMGIAHCDSRLALDLTRNLEIWTFIQWKDVLPHSSDEDVCSRDAWIEIVAGKGVGKNQQSGELCISKFARQLLALNLRPLVPKDRSIRLEIVFPRGENLALKTSNKSFGVVDGLALIGTQAEAYASASPDQLQQTLEELRMRSCDFPIDKPLIFVIGENGLDLALSLGIQKKFILKIGNWIGPLIVAAAENGINQLLLIGYHGKLIKLAGGIFHTHHHLADARLEVLAALAVRKGFPIDIIQAILTNETVEDAFLYLLSEDQDLAEVLWNFLAAEVEIKSTLYIRRYGSWSIKVGAALFDRQRELRWLGPLGGKHLASYGVSRRT